MGFPVDHGLINIVILFVLRQLAKFGADFDWVKAKKDLDARVRQLMPGEFFDDEAQGVADAVLAGLRHVLNASPERLALILDALAAGGSWKHVLDGLRRILDAEWSPWPAPAGAQRLAEDLAEHRPELQRTPKTAMKVVDVDRETRTVYVEPVDQAAPPADELAATAPADAPDAIYGADA